MYGKQSKLERPQEWVAKPWGEAESIPPHTLASPFACCCCVTSRDSPKWRACSQATCIEEESKRDVAVSILLLYLHFSLSLLQRQSIFLLFVVISAVPCCCFEMLFTLTGPHNMLIDWAHKLSVWKSLGRENLILAYPVIFIKDFCMNNRV